MLAATSEADSPGPDLGLDFPRAHLRPRGGTRRLLAQLGLHHIVDRDAETFSIIRRDQECVLLHSHHFQILHAERLSDCRDSFLGWHGLASEAGNNAGVPEVIHGDRMGPKRHGLLLSRG